MNTVSRSFYRDLSKARQARTNAAKTVVMVRLTKKGAPSKIAEDTHHFDTLEQAEAYIARIYELNPGIDYKYQVTMNGQTDILPKVNQ